ncbi:MAG: hypothetical protein EBR40_04210 [Proteobacteria bacterium]|nr:hypothetical protein [Pseudomonadota bacterium]
MHFFTHRFASFFLFLLCSACAVHGQSASTASSEKVWVSEGSNGHLVYGTNNLGDRIPDFSHAGYGGGGVKIPDVPVQKTVSPSAGDDSAAIQEAVNAVGAMPLKDGFRGTVLLSPGTFHCSNTITLSQDGVVLRGSGTNEATGTTIEMTGAAHTCVSFTAAGRKATSKGSNSTPVKITDAYLPCGSTVFSVESVAGLKAGDTIAITRPWTKEWIHSVGMDALVRSGKPQTWMRENATYTYERIIRSIDGNRITLDVPIGDAIDMRLIAPQSVTVTQMNERAFTSQCGLESLRINSQPPSGMLTAPNNMAVNFNGSRDCWVRGIFMNNTLVNVYIAESCRRITVSEAVALHTSTIEKGAGYPADYVLRGSQILIDRCSTKGDGSFFVDAQNAGSNLNAVLNCTFVGGGAIQPHARWSTSMLADNCHVPDGGIEYINRGTCGSGHGWAMAWGVAWNCTAQRFDIQQPPGCINWCIGCVEIPNLEKPSRKKPKINEGFFSFGTPVLPKSLYLAQLKDRLGEQAVKNIGY